MPREQLEELGVNYRRIPVMAIGRDIYCDSRLMFDKLEQLFPDNRLGAQQPFEKGIEYLLENWVNDGGPFGRTASLIPPTADVMNDPEWIKDRTGMTGRPFNKDTLAAMRPDGLAHSRMYFDMAENMLMGDGRKYVLNTPEPTLADIHGEFRRRTFHSRLTDTGIWTYDWTLQRKMNMYAELDKQLISENTFPKVFAWIERLRKAYDAALEKNGKAEVISDRIALDRIFASGYIEPEGDVDKPDPLQLKKGQMVDISPVDSGSSHHDKGELLSLGLKEVVIQKDVPNGKGQIRVHFPRINFSIKAVQEANLLKI